MGEREENLFERRNNVVEACIPLNEELCVQTDLFAKKYDIKAEDALRQFLRLGFKCNRAVEKGSPKILLIGKNGSEHPLLPVPKRVKETMTDSEKPIISYTHLNLYRKERRELSRIAKKNKARRGEIFDGFVELGLKVVDIMEKTESKIVLRNRDGEEKTLIFMPTKKHEGSSSV